MSLPPKSRKMRAKIRIWPWAGFLVLEPAFLLYALGPATRSAVFAEDLRSTSLCRPSIPPSGGDGAVVRLAAIGAVVLSVISLVAVVAATYFFGPFLSLPFRCFGS